MTDLETYAESLDRREAKARNCIMWAKEHFDLRYFGSTHPLAKYNLLPEWYYLQERIQPYVDELNLIEKRRRLGSGDDLLPLHK